MTCPVNSHLAITVHAWLMGVAWLGLVPFGIYCARFLKAPQFLGNRWFLVHWVTTCVSVVFSVIAFTLVYIAKDCFKTGHFDTLHSRIGLGAVVAAVVQLILGVIIDRMYTPTRRQAPLRDKAHWIIGFALVLATTVNIILGLNSFNAGTLVKALVYGHICLCIVIFMVSYFRITRNRSLHYEALSDASEADLEELLTEGNSEIFVDPLVDENE